MGFYYIYFFMSSWWNWNGKFKNQFIKSVVYAMEVYYRVLYDRMFYYTPV